jgi:hypothetical protein
MSETKFRLGANTPETIAPRERHSVMTALKNWTEFLRCVNCGQAGVACLAQPIDFAAPIVINDMPVGFIAVHRSTVTRSFVKPATVRRRKQFGDRLLARSASGDLPAPGPLFAREHCRSGALGTIEVADAPLFFLMLRTAKGFLIRQGSFVTTIPLPSSRRRCSR